jgi:hypothetical protein
VLSPSATGLLSALKETLPSFCLYINIPSERKGFKAQAEINWRSIICTYANTYPGHTLFKVKRKYRRLQLQGYTDSISSFTREPFLVHCKKRLSIFPSPAGMPLTKLSMAGNNLIISDQGEFD